MCARCESNPFDAVLDVFRKTDVPMFLMDQSGKIAGANASAEALFDFAEGTQVPFADAALAWGGALARPAEMKHALPGKDGRPYGLAKLTEPVVVGDGSFSLFAALTACEMEASEREKRSEHLAVAAKMAARLNHELKNPLAAVVAGLQTLEHESGLSEEDYFVLRLVLDEVRSISRVLTRFSDTTRREMKSFKPLSLAALLEECAGEVTPLALRKEVRLRIVGGPPGIEIMGDAAALGRAVKNLLYNAVDACRKQDSILLGWRRLGESETSATAPEHEGSIVGIYGEDTGLGLPSDLSVSTIFKPFVTTKRSGIGLGLSVTQEIIEAHGGLVFLRPGNRGGAMFEVLMPIWTEDRTNARSGAQSVSECRSLAPLCWTEKGKTHHKDTGEWAPECIECRVFRSYNLTRPPYPPKAQGKEE